LIPPPPNETPQEEARVRKLAITGLALVAAIAMSAVAFAQSAAPTITATGSVAPANAGTKAKPANGLYTTVFNVNPESDSTLSRIEYTIPSNVKLSGKGFKSCSADFINANGDDGCPKGSKVGTGAATALLGPQKSQLNFDVEVYVAGPKALTLYLQTSLFNIAIPATISGQVVAFDIPERVQRPVSGLYSYVTSVTAKLGKQTGIPATTKIKRKVTVKRNGKKKRVTKTFTVPFASVVGCTNGQHTGGVKAFLASNPNPPQVPFLQATTQSACTK
jgi:hypothetical protein